MYQVEEESHVFEFERGGKEYSVPCLQDIPLDTFKEMQKRIDEAGEERESEAIYATLDLIEAYAKGSTKGMSMRQATNLVKAYIAETGDNLGESSTLSD
jgi:hypothetical protein